MRNWRFLVLSYLFVHFSIFSLALHNEYSFPQGLRYLLEKDAPIIVFIALYCIKELQAFLKIKLFRDLSIFCFIVCSLLIPLISIGGYISGLVFIDVFGFKWSYHAIVEYYVFFFVFILILKRMNRFSTLEAILLSFLLVFQIGLIYELPLYSSMAIKTGNFSHATHPFFVEFRFILPFLLINYFWNKGFRGLTFHGKVLMIYSYPLWMLIQANYFSNRYLIGGWFWRLPTIIFFILMLLSLRRDLIE